MTEQLARHLQDFALHRTTFNQLQDWFIDYVMGSDVHPVDQTVADHVEGAMAEFTGGHITEAEFRNAVAKQLHNLTIISSQADEAARPRTSSAGRTIQVEFQLESA